MTTSAGSVRTKHAAPRWTAERVVSRDEAQALIAAQFPDVRERARRAVRQRLGQHRVPGRRRVRLSLSAPRDRRAAHRARDRDPAVARRRAACSRFPRPRFAGTPCGGYPWPFAGYPVSRRNDRVRTARRAGRHTARARARGICARAACARSRRTRSSAACRATRSAGSSTRAASTSRATGWSSCARRARTSIRGRCSSRWPPIAPRADEGDARIVHGDLYARHVLLAGDGALAGVIDWGDVHVGDPALDLAVGDLIFTPADRAAFFAAYGDIGERTRLRARYRAIYHAALVADYGTRIGDAALVCAGVVGARAHRRARSRSGREGTRAARSGMRPACGAFASAVPG